MNIKKGDTIKMTTGKDRGKTGLVLTVFPDAGKISAEGLNLYKKRVRPKSQGQKGETVLVPRPFFASRALLVCSNCKKAVRTGHRFEGERKVRYCKKCGAIT